MVVTRQTSIDAYHAVLNDGTVNRQQRKVYKTLYNHGPLTATECLTRCDLLRTGRARFSELRERGLVYEVDTRICSVTGKTVIAWDVTANLPGPRPKAKPKGVPVPTKREREQAVQDMRDIYAKLVRAGNERPFSEALIKVLRWLDR